MSLILIGFKNSGKSTLGALLAKARGAVFIDTDELLSESMSVRDYYDMLGEDGFRAREAEVIAALSPSLPAVIATGGGALLRASNVTQLKSLGKIVYLQQDKDILRQRAEADAPLFIREQFDALYQQRVIGYQAAADVVLNLSGLNQAQSIRALMEVSSDGQ